MGKRERKRQLGRTRSRDEENKSKEVTAIEWMDV